MKFRVDATGEVYTTWGVVPCYFNCSTCPVNDHRLAINCVVYVKKYPEKVKELGITPIYEPSDPQYEDKPTPTPVQESAAEWEVTYTCPNCHSSFEKSTKFCPDCGTQMSNYE